METTLGFKRWEQCDLAEKVERLRVNLMEMENRLPRPSRGYAQEEKADMQAIRHSPELEDADSKHQPTINLLF